MKELERLKSNLGMSLIEVMIVMTIMSLIGLGTATLMKNMFSIQRRSSLKSVAADIQNQMETMLKNDTAWAATVNHASNVGINCLQDGVGGCNHRPYSGNPAAPGQALANNLNIFDTTGTNFYNGFVPGRGFSDTGANCGSFDPAGNAGSDACPFRYNFSVYSECPGAVATCPKPQITILGIMLFNPADPSDPRNRLNVDDYTIELRRGERVRYEPLEIQYSVTTNNGGGNCPAVLSNWRGRPINPAPEYDVGGNIVGINGAGGRFTLRPGTYECKVVAQAFEALDGFSVRLRDLDNDIPYPIGGGFSGTNATAYATGTVTLQLTANTRIRLEHSCGGPNSEHPEHDFEMGIPSAGSAGYAGGSVFTSITCVRSS